MKRMRENEKNLEKIDGDEIYLKNGRVVVNSSSANAAASPVIKKIAWDVLRANKDQRVSLRHIREMVEIKTGERFSSGSFSGAMRDLIEESGGKIVNVERGYYSFVGHAKTYEINSAIDKLILELEEAAYVNLLKAEDEDIEAIRAIPYIQQRLEELKLKL